MMIFLKIEIMMIKKVVRNLLFFFRIDISRIISFKENIRGKKVMYNVNNTSLPKRCLILYITQPFQQEKIKEVHQNLHQVKEMARIIGLYGYIVDVAQFNNKNIKLKYSYDLVVGLIPRGIDIYTKHMNPGCIQIAYLTSMNLAVTSENEEKRIEECFQRRGVRLKPRRFAGYIEKRIEKFDAVWYIGNRYNYQSYTKEFNMPPCYFIKNTGYVFNWANPNVVRDSHSFMYFGSAGQVHKGLDLLLELFAEEIKDCTLYVCGNFAAEEDFAKEYHKELYETPNIVPVGLVNIETSQYEELAKKCAYTILPSCAEGCAGSVLTNMSAGIIPIVSRECGFEDDEVIILPDCKKKTIMDYVMKYCKKDSEWIRMQSNHSIKIVRERYLDKNFTESIKRALTNTLKSKK